MANDLISKPLTIVAESGQILIDSGTGVAFAMTADAALESAERLYEEAVRAFGQLKYTEWNTARPPS